MAGRAGHSESPLADSPTASLEDQIGLWRVGDPGALERIESWPASAPQPRAPGRALRGLAAACAGAPAPAARVFAGTLARLARAGGQAGGHPGALHADLTQMCAALFGRYLTFTRAVSQLRTVPGYALPFDLTLAVAHCCALLRCLAPEATASSSSAAAAPPSSKPWLAADPQLAVQLLELAQAPPLGVEDANFVFATEAVRRRSACLCRKLAEHIRGRDRREGLPSPAHFDEAAEVGVEGSDWGAPWAGHVSLGDEVELQLAGSGPPEAARVALLDCEEALVRGEGAGVYARVHAALLPDAQGRSLGTERHYAALGLRASAPPSDVARAFRRLARQHHPDKGGDQAAFRRVREAFEALSLAARPPVPSPPAGTRAAEARVRPGAGAARTPRSAERSKSTPPPKEARSAQRSKSTPPPKGARSAERSKSTPPSREARSANRSQSTPPAREARSARRPEASPTPTPRRTTPPSSEEPASRRRLRPLRAEEVTPPAAQPVRRRLRSKTPPGSARGSPWEQPAFAEPAVSITAVSRAFAGGAVLGRPASQPPAKRRCRRAAAAVAAPGAFAAGGKAVPPHELTVNGILQLIWSFAF